LTIVPGSGINRTKSEQNSSRRVFSEDRRETLSMSARFQPETLSFALAQPDGTSILARLRQALGAKSVGESPALVPFGVAPVDDALGGGLEGGILHEIAAAREAEVAAASGFALLLAARTSGPVVWIAEDMALYESGAPYGPGIDELGLHPERFILVAAPKSRDVLWAVEEALSCRGMGAVIGEIRQANLDLTATRRLSLAAGRRGAVALLLRSAPGKDASAAATRWIVKAAPSTAKKPQAMTLGPGPPRFALSLVRNRRGPPGSWVLEWNGVEQHFELVSAHRERVAQAVVDRSTPAASA
jgi:protein ImuA